MENSIENIWKEGFSNQKNQIPPKIVNLYNRKSINAVDNLLELGKTNLYFIVTGGIVLLSIAINYGVTLYGMLIFLLLMISVKYGKDQSKKVEAIDKSQSSYTYLKDVQKWLDETILGYTRIYRFVYPGLIIVFFLGFMKSDALGDTLITIKEKSPDLITFLDIPLIWYIPIIILALFSMLFTSRIFKADLNIVYKNVIQKLEDLIADMEDLSQEDSI